MARILPYTPDLQIKTQEIHPSLQDYVELHLSLSATERCVVRSLEAGGDGDCLFHSFAAALEALILKDAAAAAHVFAKVPRDVFSSGKRALVEHLRKLSADGLDAWPPETLLDFACRAASDFIRGDFEDRWDPDPVQMLKATGFGFLLNCESVLACGDAPDGDAGDIIVRLAFTDAVQGGGARREELIPVSQGYAQLAQLRNLIQAQIERPGNDHWGNQFDVNSLSMALDLGILLFCNRLQLGGRACLYNIGSQREDFPYWISLWWNEPVHFRLASIGYRNPGEDCSNVSYTSAWTRDELPEPLWREYRACNRLTN